MGDVGALGNGTLELEITQAADGGREGGRKEGREGLLTYLVLLVETLHDACLTVGVPTDGVAHGLDVGALGDGALELKGIRTLPLDDLQVLGKGGREGGRVGLFV